MPANPTTTMKLMLLGYGVGLSWGAAVIDLGAGAPLLNFDYSGQALKRGLSVR